MVAMTGGRGSPLAGGPGFDRIGEIPFREKSNRDPLEALKVLLAAGANPNVKAPDGSTPLHQAVQARQVAIIRTLAEAGASLSATNKDNLTPLQLAEKPAGPTPVSQVGPGVIQVKRDTREEVIAALRELMKLGPNDPTPVPPPAPVPARSIGRRWKKRKSRKKRGRRSGLSGPGRGLLAQTALGPPGAAVSSRTPGPPDRQSLLPRPRRPNNGGESHCVCCRNSRTANRQWPGISSRQPTTCCPMRPRRGARKRARARCRGWVCRNPVGTRGCGLPGTVGSLDRRAWADTPGRFVVHA
jgi:hypothetical protein